VSAVANIGLGAAVGVAFCIGLVWKWQLGLRRSISFLVPLAIAVLVILSALAGVAGWSGPWLALAGITSVLAPALAVVIWRFYRDPERISPGERDAVLSPADGEVIYVRHSQGGRLPSSTKKGRDYELVELTKTPLRHEDAIVVGIAMSFLDVHVNRAPIAGRVRLRQHFPGRFGSLGRPEMIYENERATTVIERGDMEIAMVQIASRLVRQIASYVKVGENVALGQRVGVIRLGSQVDVVLPARPDVAIAVREGQRVRAGETVLANVGTGASDSPPSAEPASAVV
jgi:phosphatidylserine decarboxylase